MKLELPTNLEFNVMDYIYRALTKDGCFSSQKAERISANLGFSGDLELIRTSKYINVLFTNAEESFELTALGKKYMEHFYHLVKRNYSDLAGTIKDGEMINTDKRNRAKQKAKESMKDWNSNDEDEKNNLPTDLFIKDKKWWEKTWVQLIMLLGAIAGIISLI